MHILLHVNSIIIFCLIKIIIWGLPCRSSGYDSMLPLQGAWVWFLVKELKFQKPRTTAKKELFQVGNTYIGFKNQKAQIGTQWKIFLHLLLLYCPDPPHSCHPPNTYVATSTNTWCVLPVSFSSVTQLCLTLCDPMDCSTPGFPVLHHLLELAQTHVHQGSDAI